MPAALPLGGSAGVEGRAPETQSLVSGCESRHEWLLQEGL